MSHIVQITTEVRDETAVQSACKRLHLPRATHGTFELYSSTEMGLGIELPHWKYPVVANLKTGQLRYDNFNGRWGSEDFLDRFMQFYAIEKAKIEIRGDKIRALYGHSLRGVIVGEMKWPKTELFHATRERHLESILEHGLRPQGRTWVHLTSNARYADTILRNHDYKGSSVLLRVVPDLLEDFDITFRKPNSHVWLVNHIPPVGIKICEPNGHSELC